MTSTSGARTAPEVLARLRARGARRWYTGAAFGLVYQAIEVAAVWTSSTGSLVTRISATALLLVIYAIYVLVPPLLWPERAVVRIGGVLAYWALTCVMFPLIAAYTIWIWPLVVVLIGFTWLPRPAGFGLLGAVVGVQLLVAWGDAWSGAIAFAPYVTLSVGVAMIGFGGLIQRNAQLRAAQDEVTRLAISEERARLARDLHDSLGHSLTVVAVKSELARKLVGRDPAKAEAEIADIERLAREGLADLRAAVAGYRDVDLESELASARTALAAAGIAAHLPDDVAIVRPELRPLFGWVVREGVTNVIRHAGAGECWIELGRGSVVVRDDGAGMAADRGPGHGLRGLRERAAAVGATLACTPGARGGFTLEVTA